MRYGPHERNVIDLWLPKGASSDHRVPVLTFFHGGSFAAGDKGVFDPTPYLEMGYAAASPNYRFVNGKDVLTPIPMQDCTRAVQFLRHKAGEYGIDPARVALSGNSAGAVIAIWIAYKDDMADPASDDPVERQSTRVTCIVPRGGPTNLDPAWIFEHVGGSKEVHACIPLMYGVRDGNYGGEVDNVPLPSDAAEGKVVHHAYFGKVLKDKLDKLGVESDFHYGSNPVTDSGIGEFLKKHLSP